MTEAEEVVKKKLSLQLRDGKITQARVSIPVHWVEQLGVKEPVYVKLEFYPEEGKVVVVFPKKQE